MIFKHSLHTYLQYVLKKSLLGISYGLQPIERYLAGKYGESEIHKYPPVFIIGAPRCGSTLLYKVLTERYYFTFLSNFTAPLYRIPIIGTWMQKKLNITLPQGNYTFHYGIVAGAGAPCECGQFWYRWFPKGYRYMWGEIKPPQKYYVNFATR